MAWEGWYEFGGVEFINTDRTEAYAQHANVGWFKPVVNNGALARTIGEPEYTSPLQDDAPWVDPDQPQSFGFYGCYPLEITGIEDSTMTAPVTESTGDGGVVGRVRRATRPVVFSLALIGDDECSVSYGFNWLKAALSGGPCTGRSDQDCNVGTNLCFLDCPPCVDDCTPFVGEVGTTVATVARRNLAANPSMEVSIGGWSAAAGLAAPTRKVSKAAHGSARLSAFGNNSSTAPRVVTGVSPVAPAEVYQLSARVRADIKNLAKNGGFDSGIASWAKDTVTLAPIASARTGAGAVIGWGSGNGLNAEGITQTVTGLTVGKQYRLVGWFKNDTNGAKAKPHMRLGTPSTNGTAVTSVGAWTQSSLTFTATATSAIIAVTNSATTAKGTTQVDDIVLYALENVPSMAVFNVANQAGTTITEIQDPWAPDATGYQSLAYTITVPAGATGLQFRPGLTTPANYTGEFGVDQVIIEKVTSNADPFLGYFDGDTGDTSLFEYDWAGPVGLSTSTQSSLAVDPSTVPVLPEFDPEVCFDALLRSLHACTTTVGPVVTGKRTTTDGGCVWTVSVTIVAANPIAYSDERPLIRGFGDPNVDVPYIGGVVPPGGSFDVDGFIETEASCPVPTFQPLVDPLCPIVIAPPPVPNIALSCFEFPVNYKRRQFTIPPQRVPLWGQVVPYFEINTPGGEVRSLRLRFYADPDGDGSTLQDPCAFCGDIVFSYIPAGSTMIFDGADRQVYVQAPNGSRQRADALVFGSDGSPFEWPEMTCGYGYVVTLDLPQQAAIPVVNMSLFARAV